jgi:hypothetical protein
VADAVHGWLGLAETVGRLEQCELYRGDWRLRFGQHLVFPGGAPDVIYVEMDPMRFEGNPPALAAHNDRAALYVEDVALVTAALNGLEIPVVVQISSFTANNGNRHDDTVAAIDGVMIPAGFSLEARVQPDGHKISLVYARGRTLWEDHEPLSEQFDHWRPNQ